jgi:uncharacterized lipoprotein YajG
MRIVTQRKPKKTFLQRVTFFKIKNKHKILLFKQNLKKQNMKKLFIVLAVAALASCNNDAKTEEKKSDTTVTVVPNADTVTTIVDTTITTRTDTTKH